MKAKKLLETLAEIRQAEKSLKKQREIIQTEIMDLPDFKVDPFAFGIEYVDLITVRGVMQPIRNVPWSSFREMMPDKHDIVDCALKLRYDPETVDAAKMGDIIESTVWADEWGIIDLPGQVAIRCGQQPETSYQLVQKRRNTK